MCRMEGFIGFSAETQAACLEIALGSSEVIDVDALWQLINTDFYAKPNTPEA